MRYDRCMFGCMDIENCLHFCLPGERRMAEECMTIWWIADGGDLLYLVPGLWVVNIVSGRMGATLEAVIDLEQHVTSPRRR